MVFAAPAFLLLLLVCAGVALLHARRQTIRTVGSLQLWKAIATTGAKARTSWHWPRPSVALFLQLAIVAALVLGLAQPFWMRNAAPEHWIVVVDASASMQASDIQPSRFDAAIDRVRAILLEISDKAVPRLSLISAGSETALHAARIENKPHILDAYLSALPLGGSPDWDRVQATALPLIKAEETTRILLFTDGQIDGPKRLAGLPTAGVDVFRFATSVANAGLTAAVHEPKSVADGKASALLEGEILLSGLQSTTLTIEFIADGNSEPLVWQRRDISASLSASSEAQSLPFSFALDLPQSGLITVRLPEDAATFDNEAHFRILAEPEPFQALYLGDGNAPLLKALQAIDGVSIFEADGLPDDLDQFQLVVADGVVLPREPDTNVLFVGAGRLESEPDPEAFNPAAPSHWALEGPLAQEVDLGALQISTAYRHPAGGDWQVLLQAENDPLLQWRDTTGGRQLRMSFQPSESNWPELTNFPVFIGNLVRSLGPMPGSRLPAPCQVGQPCPVPAELQTSQIAPQPSSLPGLTNWSTTAQGAPAFTPAQPGVYRIGAGARSYIVPVNADLATESAEVSLSLERRANPEADGRVWEGWAGLLIVAALLLALEAWLSLRRATLSKSLLPLLPRLVALAFIALALLNLPLPHQTNARNLIAVGTEWTSTAGDGSLLQSASNAVSVGLITMGLVPSINADLGEDTAVHTAPTSAFDVASALRLGAAMLPPDEPGRLALLAPHRETIGDLSGAVSELSARGIAVDVLAPTALSDQVAILALDQAGQVFAGDDVPVTAIAYSDAERYVTLRARRGDEEVTAQDIHLRAGYNRLQTILPDAASVGDIVSLALGLADEITANNQASLAIAVQQSPRILILTPQVQQGEALAEMLRARNMDATVLEPRRAPWRLPQYLQYDAIILANVPAIDLDTRQQLQLEIAVAEHGRGLLILGGENSFGPGGYLETPLERISPLSSKVPRDAPEAALVFVLDRSGSMSQKVGESTRLEIAKQATQAAIDLLGEGSQVAITVFDSEAQVPLPLQPASNSESIRNAIASIDAGGGTAIVPGLIEGLRQLEGAEAPARHIILMTDGLSTPGDVDGIMNAIKAEGITVSAVAIGEGADVTSLRRVADLGGGSFHATSDFRALPGILSQEAMLLSGSPIEEGATQPQWAGQTSSDLPTGPLPPIDGFVVTTAKNAAELSLVAPDKEGELMPLLASWRYGNGEVFALTTHAAGPWTQRWLENGIYPRLFSQIVRNVLSTSRAEGLVLDIERRRDEVLVQVSFLNEEGQPLPDIPAVPTVTQSPTSGSATPQNVKLVEVSLGLFQGKFVASDPGDYTVTAEANGQTRQAQLVVSYGDQFNPESDLPKVVSLAEKTGGRIVSSLDELTKAGEARWTQTPAKQLWISLAFVVFLLDLLWRYLPLRRHRG